LNRGDRYVPVDKERKRWKVGSMDSMEKGAKFRMGGKFLNPNETFFFLE
jgi:hypothetical protein